MWKLFVVLAASVLIVGCSTPSQNSDSQASPAPTASASATPSDSATEAATEAPTAEASGVTKKWVTTDINDSDEDPIPSDCNPISYTPSSGGNVVICQGKDGAKNYMIQAVSK